jgi:murein DD-endopeptidase MepM/ murein hydrolase activator NlpD
VCSSDLLRFRGWFVLLLFLLVAALAGLNVYLWDFYARSQVLEKQLVEAQRLVHSSESQLLSLTGKLQILESNLYRVQQFDAKLRVIMNIDESASSQTEDSAMPTESARLNNPVFLSQHRELFTRRLHTLIDELSSSVHLEEIQQQTLVSFLRDNKDALLSTPSIWPAKGYLTSGFGYRSSPFTGRGSLHKGLDISNRIGTPIWAPARGAVTFSGPDGAYGICVVIDHGNNIVTRYAHMSKTLVTVGQYVQRGDVIGHIGNTGRSTGPHLHYEVIVNGAHVNPMRYIMN